MTPGALASPAPASRPKSLRWASRFGDVLTGCGAVSGAASGGWLIAHFGFAPLNWVGLAWIAAALGLSPWVGQRRATLA
jgi:hypothetical protein